MDKTSPAHGEAQRGLGVALWRQPAFLIFATLTFPAAMYASVFTHEVLGHGVMAWALGGRLYAFFVNPFGGRAYDFLSRGAAWRNDLVMAAGVLVQLILGGVLWPLVTRPHGLAARLFLLIVSGASLLSATLYIGVNPLVTLLTGDPTGDISYLIGRWNTPAVPVGVVGLAVALWLTVCLCNRLLSVLTAGGVVPNSRRGVLGVLWVVMGPGLALEVLGLTICAPLLTNFFLTNSIGGLAAFGVFYAAGAAIAARRWRSTEVAHSQGVETSALWKGVVVLALVVAALVVFFGPTDRTARAVMLSAPGSEVFPGWEVRLRMSLVVQPDLNAEAHVVVRSIPETGSPLEQELASAVNAAGPDEAGMSIGRAWLKEMLPRSADIGALPLERVGEGWSIGSRLGLQNSRVLASLPGQRWRLALEVSEAEARQIEQIQVRLQPGLKLLGAEGFRQEADVFVWEPQNSISGTTDLILEFTRAP